MSHMSNNQQKTVCPTDRTPRKRRASHGMVLKLGRSNRSRFVSSTSIINFR
ncbi:10016_t:CDS:2, partial [Dentiscutata heterogama]